MEEIFATPIIYKELIYGLHKEITQTNEKTTTEEK